MTSAYPVVWRKKPDLEVPRKCRNRIILFCSSLPVLYWLLCLLSFFDYHKRGCWELHVIDIIVFFISKGDIFLVAYFLTRSWECHLTLNDTRELVCQSGKDALSRTANLWDKEGEFSSAHYSFESFVSAPWTWRRFEYKHRGLLVGEREKDADLNNHFKKSVIKCFLT